MATREQLIEDFADHKYATGEKFARLINSMKVVQEPVETPAASGTSLSFIDSIEQDKDGKITATKKTLDLSNVHELNPFKGWWKTGDTLPTSGFDGAYLYFKDTTQSPAVTTIYQWNGTTYADTGTVVDESNVNTFGSGQALNEVKIKDENGEEVQGSANVLSAEAGKRLNEKGDYLDVKNLTVIVSPLHYNGNTEVTTGTTLRTRILINDGYKAVRAKLGYYSSQTSWNAITFFSGYSLDANNILGYVTAKLPTSSGLVYETYYAEIPEGCTLIAFTDNTAASSNSVKVSGFSDYLKKRVLDDVVLLPHTKIVDVFPGYLGVSNSQISFYTSKSNFDSGTSLYTRAYKVTEGDVITFDNPNGYLIAYWWVYSDGTASQTWFGSTAPERVVKTVPTNAVTVYFGFRKTNGLTFGDYVPINVSIEHPMDSTPTANSPKPITSGGVYNSIQTLESELDDKLDKYVEEDITSTVNIADKKWIVYANGKCANAASDSLIKMFYFSAVGIKKVKAYLGWDGPSPAAIAFYSSTNFDPTNQFPSGNGTSDGAGGYVDGSFMKSDSVQAITGKHWYEADVPENAKWIAVSNRGAVEESPQIIVLKSNTDLIPPDVIAKIDKSLDLASTGYAINPFVDAPYYAHIAADNFYITDGGYRGDFAPEGYNIGKWTIASQSIKDVEISARLGFKFIEANCQHTSDGQTICIHGDSGAFGQEVKSTDESVITTTDLRNTTISSKTLEWINTYVRYNSYYSKYQTKIPTLDEFCQACKRYGIGLYIGQATEADVKLAMRYMGNNLIVYNGPSNIRNYFDGYVLRWTNDSSKTPAQLLEEARSYGAPFICGLGTTLANNLYNDDTLSGLVDDLHKEGFLVCCTGNYDTEARTRRYFEMGFDFSSSGHQVNPFESNYEVYELGNPKDETLPSGIISTGTYTGGELTLSTGQTISCSQRNFKVAADVVAADAPNPQTMYIERGESKYKPSVGDVFMVVPSGSGDMSIAVTINAFSATTIDINDSSVDVWLLTVSSRFNLTNGTIVGLSDKIELGKGYLAIEYEGEITVDFGYRRQGGQYTERRNISNDGTKALIITDFFLWQTTQLVITATASTVVKSMLYKISKC